MWCLYVFFQLVSAKCFWVIFEIWKMILKFSTQPDIIWVWLARVKNLTKTQAMGGNVPILLGGGSSYQTDRTSDNWMGFTGCHCCWDHWNNCLGGCFRGFQECQPHPGHVSVFRIEVPQQISVGSFVAWHIQQLLSTMHVQHVQSMLRFRLLWYQQNLCIHTATSSLQDYVVFCGNHENIFTPGQNFVSRCGWGLNQTNAMFEHDVVHICMQKPMKYL